MDIIEQLNQYLLETEQYSNEYLPLQQTLEPIKEDINMALLELKDNINNSTELSDKVFYLNRYIDLLKKIEGIFEAKSKRLQQALYALAKINIKDSDSEKNKLDDENNIKDLTPEQANEILKILHNK